MGGNPLDNCTPKASRYEKCTDSVFDRVTVSYLNRGGSRLFWELRDDFTDEPPYRFRIQVGESGNPNADDWEYVGDEVWNAFTGSDPVTRPFGKINRLHYRIELSTNDGIYYSDPTGAMGTLAPRDWRIAREQLRQEQLRMEKGTSGQEGYLLKRRITGEDCKECLDHLTQEITDPNCQYCWGTGKQCGYFYPMDCIWADMDPKTYRTHLDAGQARGTVNDIVVRARMVNIWLLGEEDVWINRITDDRYYVHTVQNIVEVRGIPIVANVELRPAPFTDVIYDIEIPGQGEGDPLTPPIPESQIVLDRFGAPVYTRYQAPDP